MNEILRVTETLLRLLPPHCSRGCGINDEPLVNVSHHQFTAGLKKDTDMSHLLNIYHSEQFMLPQVKHTRPQLLMH